MGSRLIAFLLSAFCASNLTALTLTVTAGGVTPPVVSATARRVDRAAPTRELQLPIGSATTLDLGEGTWEITPTSDKVWAAPLYVTATDAATLQLWPRATIGGTLAARNPASGEMIVTFAQSGAEPGPAGVTVCPFEKRQWSCSFPAGDLDLHFNLTGFATEFRWNVKAAAADPIALDFTPGSSVSGKVVLKGSELLQNAEVSLRPSNLESASGRIPRYTANPDARGFFQVRGLAAGDYVLRAAAGDLISESRKVQIIARTNAALREPVVLAKPGRLSVKITPPLDLDAKPWQVTMLMKREGGSNLDTVDRSLASADGTWSHQRVVPGEYIIGIQQQDGGEWADEEFTIGGGESRSFDIVLHPQQVSGTVKLGTRAIAATVRFGGENGPAFIADKDGRFRGVVPPIEKDEATLLVLSDTPDVKRTLVLKGERSPDGELQFEIVLPATTLVGRTINDDGSPERFAIVTLRSKDDRVFEQMFSKTDGSFQFEGFDAGLYSLQAEGYEKASDVIDVEARSEDASPTDLVLRREEQVRGRIFMNGAPIAGADVYTFPRDRKSAFLRTITSDAAGYFVATLPPGTSLYDVIVVPRGFYVTSARVTRDPTEGLRVEVGQNGGVLSVDAPDDQTMMLLGHAGGEFSVSWLAWKTEGVTVRENGRQRLTIPNLEPGPYSVCRKQTCRSVYVPPFATASVTLEE